MSILLRSLRASGPTQLGGAAALPWAVIDLSHLVQPETRLLIVTPSHGPQPPPAA